MWKVLKTVQFISVSVVQNLASIVTNVSSFLSRENQEYMHFIHFMWQETGNKLCVAVYARKEAKS